MKDEDLYTDSILQRMRSIELSERVKSVLTWLLVGLATGLSVYFRLLPAQNYGAFLTGDDPVFHYRMTKHVVETGRLPEFDSLSWYPWGINVPLAFPSMHYYIGGYIYKIIAAVAPGLDLYTYTVYFPAFFSSISVPLVYLITARVWDRPAGVFSAFFLAINGGYLSRTIAGFYRHEQIAIPFILATFLLTVVAIKGESLKTTLIASLMSAVLVIITAGLWKGHRYIPAIYALTIYLLILLDKLNGRAKVALSLPIVGELIASVILPNISYLGLLMDKAFAASALMAMVIHEHVEKSRSLLRRKFLPIGVGVLCFTVMFLTTRASLEPRLLLVISPVKEPQRGQVIYTVAEHITGAQLMFFLNFGLLLGIAGLLLLFFRRTDPLKYLVLLSVLGLFYFSLNMVRVIPLFSAFLPIVVGIPFSLALLNFQNRWGAMWRVYDREIKKKRSKRRRVRVRYNTILAPSILTVLIVLTLMYTGYLGYNQANGYPLGLATYNGWDSEWFDALKWIANNTGKSDVIASWWDYGYWIETYSGRVTIANGATVNQTQIQLLAKAFMSDEKTAWKIFKMFNASYVVVDMYQEIGLGTGYPFYSPPNVYTGSNYKWTAMAFIADVSVTDYIRPFQSESGEYRFTLTPLGFNTTIMKMGVNPENMEYFELVYKTSPYPVYIFKIKDAPGVVVRPEQS